MTNPAAPASPHGPVPAPADPTRAAADARTLLKLFDAANIAGVPDATRALGPALLGLIGAAPLAQAHPLGDLPPGAPPLLISGPTGSGKSTWARLALSCLGHAYGQAEPVTIKARHMTAWTVQEIERKTMHASPGASVLIDDGLTGFATPEQITVFYDLLGRLGSHAATGCGADRNVHDDFWKTCYPRSTLIATVEDLPAVAEYASSLARWVTVHLEPGQPNVELLTHLQEQASAEALGCAADGYVRWLLAPGRLEQAVAWVDDALGHYETLAETLGMHRRLPHLYARLTAGFRAVLTYIADTASLPADRVADYGHLATEWLTAMARRQVDAEEDRPEPEEPRPTTDPEDGRLIYPVNALEDWPDDGDEASAR